MKKRFPYIITAILCLSSCHTTIYAQAKNIELAVISDIHIMDPALLHQDGKAFQDYIAHDRKMLCEGPDILNLVIDQILKAHPQVVLIPGDLTKDGATTSHHYVADNYLARLKSAGIQAFVIPGNHDVNNPHAVAFEGDTTVRVPTVSPDEFASIYADYGYGNAIARDPASLSYVAQLSDSIRLLAIDACKYYDNDFQKDSCVTHGRLKPETLDFIKTQVNDANNKGFRLLTMMHHGIVQHWTWQEKAMKEYLVENWQENAELFASLGIEVVFTGHFHAQDIVKFEKKNNTLYDIETGSTISFPSPYRFISINGNDMLIASHRITSLNGKQLDEYSKKFTMGVINSIVDAIVPTSVPDTIKNEACQVLAEAYARHLAGDEILDDVFNAQIKQAARHLRHYSRKLAFILRHLSRNLSTDLSPEDNDLLIHLSK